MSACLNPDHPHPAEATAAGQLVCAEPRCGYLLAGAIIHHWQVVSYFGRGPLADLYLARAVEPSTSSQSYMLVKVLRAPTAEPLARVDQQLGQLLALSHPHVHPLAAVGWTSYRGWLYLVSPYEEQGSLSRYLGATMLLPPLAIASIVRQIAEALQYAHERQLIHARVKAANCLLVGPATVQVSDFYSCLLAMDRGTASSPLLAPEQASGQRVPATDQYALALLTYQLLTGRPASATAEPNAPPALPAPGQPRPPSELRPDLSGQIDQTLGRALSRRPQDRYPSVVAFALALREVLEASPSGHSVPSSRIVGQYPSNPPTGGPQPATDAHRSPTPGPVALVSNLPGHTAPARVLRWAPNGTHLASAGTDESIRVWSIQHHVGLPVATLSGHAGAVLALSWSPDGTMLASAGADATVRTWLLGKEEAQTAWWGHDGSVTAIDWSPEDARIASGGVDRTVRLWDRQGTAVRVWSAHGRGGATALAWSPDGRTLATGGADHLIQLWDLFSDTPQVTYADHADEIRHLAWSPDGTLLASYAGKRDLRVCLWHYPTRRLAAVLTGHSREIVGLFWARDGTWLATAATDASLRYWDTHHRLGAPLGGPVPLPMQPVSMMGSASTGLIALGLADQLIQVVEIAHNA